MQESQHNHATGAFKILYGNNQHRTKLSLFHNHTDDNHNTVQ